MGKIFKNYDFTLIITPIFLAAFGAVMIYSASMVSAVVEGLDSTYYFYKQIQWLVLGLIAFVIFSLIPYRIYQKWIKFIVFGCILSLIAVLLFGETVNNATRAIDIGVNIQPSEFVKIAIILYLASVYSKKQAYINDFFKGVLPPLVLTGLILGLILLQPDIGTTAIIFLIACSVIFSSGIRFRHLTGLVLIGILLLLILIPQMITSVRTSRFTGAYQPFQNPDSAGYHLIQSYLAIGTGGLTGEGLGQSIQKLGYLWGAHTDFIMSIIVEELGIVGLVFVIGMLSIIVFRGFFISRKCDDSFGALLAIGISSMIAIQTFINLGSISGLLPITGVPLPFVSYGGSSLLSLMISMGILNNIAKSVKTKRETHIEDEQEEPNSNQRSIQSQRRRVWSN